MTGYPTISEGLGCVASRIKELGLERHVLELELNGHTTVPDVLDERQLHALRSDLIRLAEEDAGAPVDLVDGTSHRDRTQEVCLLFARGGETLREAVAQPKTLQLVYYLLGSSCLLSSFTGYVKGPGLCELGVHSDTAYVPDPLPPYAQLANVNLLLSDYTPEDGCLTMVPGSHRYCHRPREGIGMRESLPVVAPAGSAVVFHGNTWHGALPRSKDGVRLTLSLLYARLYMRPQENYPAALSAEQIASLPKHLRTIVVPDLPTGWASLDQAQDMISLRRTESRTWYRTRAQHI